MKYEIYGLFYFKLNHFADFTKKKQQQDECGEHSPTMLDTFEIRPCLDNGFVGDN